jgi:hypothetical protein
MPAADQGETRAQSPGDTMTDSSITLQSTVGGFTAEFMHALPKLEAVMRAHGLDPSAFVISKDRAAPATVPLIGPFFYAYTVFVGEDCFTITEPNDLRFLEYFEKRCVAADDDPEPIPLPTLRRTPPGLLARLLRWMAQPI